MTATNEHLIRGDGKRYKYYRKLRSAECSKLNGMNDITNDIFCRFLFILQLRHHSEYKLFVVLISDDRESTIPLFVVFP